MARSRKVTFDIKEEIEVLSERPNGYRKLLAMVSWNSREPRLEIREWAPDYEFASKGITLTDEEAYLLYNALGRYFNE